MTKIRNTDFLKEILNSKDFTKRFKKEFKKFNTTITKIETTELFEILFDFKGQIAEKFKINPEDTSSDTISLGILVITLEDELRFREAIK